MPLKRLSRVALEASMGLAIGALVTFSLFAYAATGKQATPSPVIETPCSIGTTPLSGQLQTVDPTTGALRYYACGDSTGRLSLGAYDANVSDNLTVNGVAITGTATIGGTTIPAILHVETPTLTWSLISSGSCATKVVTFTGTVSSGVVVGNPRADIGAFSYSFFVNANDQATIRVCNPSNGSIQPGSTTWELKFLPFQPQ